MGKIPWQFCEYATTRIKKRMVPLTKLIPMMKIATVSKVEWLIPQMIGQRSWTTNSIPDLWVGTIRKIDPTHDRTGSYFPCENNRVNCTQMYLLNVSKLLN